MSGGVDSSVAAFLLKRQGYDVIGVFMKNWSDEAFLLKGQCTAAQDYEDARTVASQLGIPLYTVNFEKEYADSVIDYFFREYDRGRTPNPDIMCNKEIKFKLFLEYAVELGAGAIATGHYARVLSRAEGGRKALHLLKGVDTSKDQSYFLYALTQDQLSMALFPVGELTKREVRALARERGLSTADKKDSQGICFVGEVDMKKFLQQRLAKKPGVVIDCETGKRVGTHEGLAFYTIGQREGLGIGGSEMPYYVVDKDTDKNILCVAKGNHHPFLYHDSLYASSVHWISGAPSFFPFSCAAKIRYRQDEQRVTLVPCDKGVRVEFERPQRAVTPGQSVVFYRGDVCLGGGIIEKRFNRSSAQDKTAAESIRAEA